MNIKVKDNVFTVMVDNVKFPKTINGTVISVKFYYIEYIHRVGSNLYLWKDGTLNEGTMGDSTMEDLLENNGSPGYYSTLTEVQDALDLYESNIERGFVAKPYTTVVLSDDWKNSAKKVWQILFNFYKERGGDINQLNCLLVDYESCKNWLNNWYCGVEVYNFEFTCYKNHYHTEFRERKPKLLGSKGNNLLITLNLNFTDGKRIVVAEELV